MRAALTALLIIIALQAQGAEKNGFNLNGALIPEDEILSGGPSRDSIPSIDKPHFVKPADAHFLQAEDRVLGITRSGVSKAYPIAIMNWHEIVNDNFAGEPVVVSFCPLCGTGMAYRAAADD